MHITDKNTVLHDSSNKYQHTGGVVISYKDIKLSLWINTETQYDNIKFAQLFFFLSQCYRFQQTENLFFFSLNENSIWIALLSFSFSSILVTFNASTNKHWLRWHDSSLLMPVLFSVSWKHNAQRWCKKRFKKIIIKNKNKQYWTKKRRIKCALCTFFSTILLRSHYLHQTTL